MALLLGDHLSGKTARVVDAYRQQLASGRSPGEIACLSFFTTNAAVIRRDLQQHVGGFLPWVTTLQRFQTLLLRQYGRYARLPRRAREIDPGARALLLRLAWERAGGDLRRAYGAAPGGLAELTRVVDWVSAQRAGFALRPGELGDHELARVYAAYIALCDEHRLLTFQEASLRCLDLLALPEVAADVARRFPVLLVDDAHLARPDQLRLLERLRALAQDAVVTAWLEADHAAPELRLAWDALHAWGPVERLKAMADVNPAVLEVARRATGGPNPAPDAGGPVGEAMVGLFVGSTVEEEMQALAARVAAILEADPVLQPADLAVVALNPELLPFAERVLGKWGLPVAPRPLPAPHTPLIRAALLAMRWVRRPRQRGEIEPELLGLPCIGLDPLDRHALLRAAALTGQPPLAVAADEHGVRLAAPARETLARLAQALAALDARLPAPALADQALEALGALAWLRADTVFTPAEHADWEQAYVEWRRMAQELEALVARGLPVPEDWDEHLAALADQVSRPAPAGDGLVLVPAELANGLRARHAFVIGLSENAVPRRRPEMQLIAEAELPRLLPGGQAPLARQPAAWLEREARALSAALTRGIESLYLSTSRHTANGDAQLPTPFFERLLGADGAIGRDGDLHLLPGQRLFQDQPRGVEPGAAAEPRPSAAAGPTSVASPPAAGLRSSATQMRAYLTCPLSYYYERVLGLETEGSAALDRGGLLHELLCVALGDGTPRAVQLWDRPRPVWLGSAAALSERAQMALEAAWRGVPADLPGGGRYVPAFAWGERFGPELQRRAVRRWMEQTLAQWADFEANGPLASPLRRPVLLEATFEFELGPHRLRGRVDRLDEVQGEAGPSYELIDYKSGKSDSVPALLRSFLPPEGKLAEDYQLPIYALALRRGALLPAPAAPLRLHLLFLENMQRGQRGGLSKTACRTIEVGAAGALDPGRGFVPLSALEGEVVPAIEATLDSMMRAPYPAQPGWACNWCSFRIACDRGQEGEAE